MRTVLVAASLVLAASAAGAQQTALVGDFSQAPGEAGIPAPWKAVTSAGKADFSLARDGELSALVMRSHVASFGFQRETKVNVDDYPLISWKWKASKLPAGGDYRHAGTDDQAAQLYVAFSKTKIIEYVWDTSAKEGSSGDAAGLPPFVSIKVLVLRSGAADLGKWLTESRNLRADYERLFGKAAGPLVVQGLQLRINSQHTRTEAEAAFADIVFERAVK
jgi:hypothetical protein